MTRALPSTAWIVVVAVLALACGESSDRGEGKPVDTPSSSPSSGPPAGPDGGSTSGAVDAAVADLAAQLGVDPTEVEVVAVEEVTWRDGSLGCARPGMSYTQALVDGSRITLRVAGGEHEYHDGGSRPPFRCAEPTE